MNIRNLAGAVSAAALLAAGGCATTSASSGGTFAGLMSNAKAAHTTFDGTFFDTLDMEKVKEGHYVVTDEDIARLALTEDPSTARGFIAMAHAASYIQTGESRNLVTDEAVTRPVREILDRILAAWDGPAPEIDIFISGDQSYHGAAFQQNFIIIPIGALAAIADERTEINGEANLVGTEDELAAFIAHEVSHILLGHYQRGVAATMTDRLNRGATTISTVGVVVGGLKLAGSGDQRTLQLANEKKSREQVESLLIGHAILKETNSLLSASASREQEDHADLLAVDLLVRAGYDPEAVSRFLDRSRQAQASQAFAIEQLNDEQKLLAGSFAQKLGGGQGNLLADIGVTAGVNILGNFVNRASATHRTTEKRLENVTGYSERLISLATAEDGGSLGPMGQVYAAYFQGAREPASGIGSQISSLRSGQAASLLDAYRKAFEAERYINSGNESARPRAAQLLNEALAVAPNEPQILLIASDYYLKAGQHRMAVTLLETAVAQPGSGPLNYANLAGAYFADGQLDKMLSAIERGEKETGTAANFLNLRISYLAANQKWEEAVAVNTQCKATQADQLINQCNTAMVPVYAELERQRQENAQKNPLNNLFKR